MAENAPVAQKNPSMDSLDVLFQNAWNRFKARFWVLVWIFLAPAVLLVLGQLLTSEKGASGGTGAGAVPIGSAPLPLASGASLGGTAVAGSILSFAGTILAVLATVGIINALARGTNVISSYRVGVKLFWAALWINILAVIAVMGGIVLLIVPGVIIAVALMFTNYALVVEDSRGMQALRRSRFYVEGYWWAVVGRALLVGAIFAVAVTLVYTPLFYLAGPAISGTVYLALFVCFTAFSAAYTYEMYENLRRLKAGAVATGAVAPLGTAVPGAPRSASEKLLSVCMTAGVVTVALLLVLVLVNGIWHA